MTENPTLMSQMMSAPYMQSMFSSLQSNPDQASLDKIHSFIHSFILSFIHLFIQEIINMKDRGWGKIDFFCVKYKPLQIYELN